MIDETYTALTTSEVQAVKAFIQSQQGPRFRAPRQPRTAPRAAIATSMRAFRRALHDSCRARLCRRQAKRAASPWHRARLIQIAMQCEARVRYAADLALRGTA